MEQLPKQHGRRCGPQSSSVVGVVRPGRTPVCGLERLLREHQKGRRPERASAVLNRAIVSDWLRPRRDDHKCRGWLIEPLNSLNRTVRSKRRRPERGLQRDQVEMHQGDQVTL